MGSNNTSPCDFFSSFFDHFSYLLNNRLEPLPGIQYSAFLIPGLIMMTLQQNAFSNSSSSLTQSKITEI